MTTNGRRLSDIEAELSDNRERVQQTLDTLQYRLSGESIVEQGRGYLRATRGDEFVFNLGRSFRRNPVPLALLGIGTGWLMLAGSERAGRMVERNAPDLSRGDGRNPSTTQATTTSAASNVAHAAKDKASRGSEELSAASDRAQRSATQMAQNARHSASRAGRATQRGTARMVDSASALYREQPLVTAALGLAFGAVIAASLPRSTRENRTLGSARDEFVASARETGQEKAGQVQSVAESAASAARDAAKSEAERQGH